MRHLSQRMPEQAAAELQPLVAAFNQMLSQTRSVGDYQALLGSNYEELERLAKMIDNMLFLAKAEDASQAMDLQDIDLAQLGEKLQDYFDGMAEEQSMRLEMALHGELRADPQLLQRALANLMANALRYGDRDSTVRIFNQGSSLMVENQGPALSAEQQARIFDRFWRADASRHQGSSGLGLSIVRSIMRLHQGSCEVYSEQGVNRFTLRFPY
ncbi:ATP-binding protein [Pantoea trifolii]|uniref:ATP-binding protein n=1 Tax=Candidatus Pantoea symbiotica TaxID=1884370 RepID=UPI0024135986|nr:ATP-binding protein [Pantoea rodasii]